MRKLFPIIFFIAVIIVTIMAAEQIFFVGGLTFDSVLDAGEIIYLAPLTLIQMMDKRKIMREENEKIIKEGKEGFRMLTDREQKTFDGNVKQLLDLDKQISEKNSINRNIKAGEIFSPFEHGQESFSLIRTLRKMTQKGAQLHDADAIVVDQGKADMIKSGITPQGSVSLPMVDHRHEQRADILAGTPTAGQEIVGTDVFNLLGPLRAGLVFSKVGSTFLTGLVGNVKIPKYSGSTAAWKTEVAESDDAAGEHDDVPLSPHRICGHFDVSKLYLKQDTVWAEETLKEDLAASVQEMLEKTALSKIAAVADCNPTGLLPDLSATFNGSLAWKDIMALPAAVDTANALEGNLAFIAHPAIRGKMKKTVRVADTDSRMIIEEDNLLGGYPCHTTTNMATNLTEGTNESGIAFANWRQFIIAQWGGMDIIVDPYTLAGEAQVRIVVNSYWDFALRHPAALAFGSCPIV
ncbi:hypothetical protein ES705_15378 [subsurface metagenome]